MAGAQPSAASRIWTKSSDPSLMEGPLQHSYASTAQPDASYARRIQESNSPLESLRVEEALAFLDSTSELPSVNDLICLLQKCRKRRNLAYAKHAHKHIREKDMEAQRELGNYLVPMYVECGSMSDAKEVFNGLVYRNEYSWTSLIQGYTEHGEWQHVFDIFEKMQQDLVRPSRHTFVAILRACIRLKSVNRGYKIHADIAEEAYETDLFVGSTLVDMYAKCGLLLEARHVFDKLPVRNTVSWTAIIAGYADNNRGEEALNCLEQMQLEGVPPDAVTFVCGLKACCSAGFLEKGRVLHVEIVKEEYERDCFIGSTLVDMYVKCGMLAEAQDVFDSLEVRDVVLWTALISGYVEHGLGKEALDCLEHMQEAGVSPNVFTFNCGLKACCSIGAFDRGRELHKEIAKEGLERDSFVGSTLVDIYAKHGSLMEARDVFDELLARDVVSWTALIAGYAEQGFDEEALECLRQMEQEDISPDAGSYVCSLKACGNLGNIYRGREMHASIAKKGLEKDTFVASALLDMYAKGGLLAEAREVLDELPSRGVVSWTALIAGYVEHGLSHKALDCFEQMQMEGMSPDAITFICILKACGSLKSLEKGQEMHAKVVKEGFERDSLVSSSLVDMYAKCGSLAEAQELFDQLSIRDVISWTALTTGYAEQGLGEEVLDCFQQMQLDGVSPDAFSWNAVIAGHAEQGDKESAFRLHAQMQDQGLLPNSVTFVSILKVCATTAALETGKRVHAQIHGVNGLKATEPILVNALIDMYCKCGMMGDAQQVFDAMPIKDLVTWNTLITGCGRRGETGLALRVFERMREEGIQPEDITFLSVLSLCSHAGLVDQGQKYFEAMSKDYGIAPNVKHHNCMVDLLGRAGRLNDVVELLERESFEPDIVTWSIVLSSCQQWGNVELGRRAFEHIVRLDERNAPAFIMMSNIYVDAEMWEDAKKIEVMRMDLLALKQPEKSWIETNGITQKFVGGQDTRHPQSKYLCTKLEQVLAKGENGSTPDSGHKLWATSDNGKKDAICQHTERLAIMSGLINSPEGSSMRLVKNVQLCKDCHVVASLVSKLEGRTIICRDSICFHFFMNGKCTCGDYWST